MLITLTDRADDATTSHGVAVAPVRATVSAASADIEALYTDHYRDVFRYVFGLTRSFEDAEEITADVFERAIRGWRQVPARPIAWLLLTARHIATDRWRRARRLGRLLSGARRPSVQEPVGQDVEFDAWFDAIAAVLSARQREVLVLRYQRDLTDADIAAVMHLTESGVRSLVARALAVLRAHPELL